MKALTSSSVMLLPNGAGCGGVGGGGTEAMATRGVAAASGGTTAAMVGVATSLSTAAGAGLTIAIDSGSLVGSGDGLGFFSVGLNIPIWFKATSNPVSAVRMVATPPVMAGNVCHHCFDSSLIGETSVLHVDAYKWNRNVNCYMVISRFKVKSSVV